MKPKPARGDGRPKITPRIKREDLTDEQRQAITEKRFGPAHPSNYPTRPMKAYTFYLEDGPGYAAGDVAGWGPVGYVF